jgi:hypothetical protein
MQVEAESSSEISRSDEEVETACEVVSPNPALLAYLLCDDSVSRHR